MKKSPAVKVLVYTKGGLGLGHLRRATNISHELCRLAPNASVLFVSDSPLTPFFTLPDNCDSIKLPTISKTWQPRWEPLRLPLVPNDQILALRRNLLKEIAHTYRPDVMLVDHRPAGIEGELISCLQHLRRVSPHTRIVLGLRDILEDGETIKRHWKEQGLYQVVLDYYDNILIFGCKHIYDAAHEYGFSEDIQNKIDYCGYVAPPLSPRQQRAENAPAASAPLVLGACGGGEDGYFVLSALVDSVRYLDNDATFNTVLLTGPFMPATDLEALTRQAQGLPITIKQSQKDQLHFLRDADLVVSMGGYNTLCEVLQHNKKSIVVPRVSPRAEQALRSRIFQQLNLIETLHPDALSAKSLADAIVRQLASPPNASAAMPSLNGANRAAQLLLNGHSQL